MNDASSGNFSSEMSLSLCIATRHQTTSRQEATWPSLAGSVGRDAHEGEITLVIGNEYFAIHDFEE